MTAAHNTWRSDVGVPPLAWSDDLAAYAQEWADALEGQQCALAHRATYTYGENLASATGVAFTPEQVVAMWGEEKAFYDSQRLGCGQASCGATTLWVCNYDPPGNFGGERPY